MGILFTRCYLFFCPHQLWQNFPLPIFLRNWKPILVSCSHISYPCTNLRGVKRVLMFFAQVWEITDFGLDRYRSHSPNKNFGNSATPPSQRLHTMLSLLLNPDILQLLAWRRLNFLKSHSIFLWRFFQAEGEWVFTCWQQSLWERGIVTWPVPHCGTRGP